MKLHKEGKGTLISVIIAIIVISAVSYYFLQNWALLIIVPLLVLYGFILWFFRNPERDIKDQVENVIAPVDGKVVMIKEVEDHEFIKGKCLQISIFMSPLNVHVCRYPVTGEVIYKKYHPGKFLVAWHEKSSELNERTSVAVKTKTNHQVLFRQIAGYVARRIVFYPEIGDAAKAGHEFGFIKFGSRMDVFLPLDIEVKCKIGDITTGGIDVIAKLPQA
ncbi:phosphatidylserine decarboxylase family protein [Elizabethkingia sp. JS20170427COW]|uniref:phosphatidylserine decarboxylase family protein n=1 Tax=Elizabethkingia sp. JS20170427COW TaxID=2583851 RepID=UPI0011101D39|nr:phosphatidylserine decarboxylase family protein [Elizabethkingia sp. JS20170427COW]QCX53026.1 phosphatidylserine decarboxylase family protein [Elizabethkingia sp. JS20170427COW]